MFAKMIFILYSLWRMFTFDYHDVSFAHKNGFTSSPKDEFHKHMHHFYELIYFETGEVDFHVEGASRRLAPGDVVFVQPGQFHFAAINRDYAYQRYVCKFPEEILPEHLRIEMTKMGGYYTDCHELLPLLQDMDAYAKEFENDHMRALCLAKMIEVIVRLGKKKNVDVEQKTDSVANALVAYIEEHLTEQLTLDSLARAFHYSASYVATAFRKQMHVSLISYVRGKKIMAAHSLIIHGMKPSQAAAMMGFTDYSTFFRGYQKLLGVAPSCTKKTDTRPEE